MDGKTADQPDHRADHHHQHDDEDRTVQILAPRLGHATRYDVVTPAARAGSAPLPTARRIL